MIRLWGFILLFYLYLDQFKKGILGSNNCPTGYRYITDRFKCARAAASLQSDEVSKYSNWPYKPKGCYYVSSNTNKFYYNSNFKGSALAHHQPVCSYGMAVTYIDHIV